MTDEDELAVILNFAEMWGATVTPSAGWCLAYGIDARGAFGVETPDLYRARIRAPHPKHQE